MHYNPDAEYEAEVEAIKLNVRCCVCKKIPLDIQQCVECDAVICLPCKAQIIEKAGQEQQQHGFQASKKCPVCQGNPQLHLTRMKNRQVIHKLQTIYETHCCPFDGAVAQHGGDETLGPQDNTIEKMTIFELQIHLSNDCERNRTCRDCSILFSSLQSYQNHLRYSCPYVNIKCSDCGNVYNRQSFREHSCYKEKNFESSNLFREMQGFSDSTMSEFVDQRIRAENKKLRKQLEE